MKLSKMQLRKLIYEAMYNPRVGKDSAIKSSDISDEDLSKIDDLANKKHHIVAGDLFSSMTDYEDISPTGTGNVYQDISDFDKQQKLAAIESEWSQYYDKLSAKEKATINVLVDPNVKAKLFVKEDEDHPDWDNEEYKFPEGVTPRTHPDHYYLYTVNTPNQYMTSVFNRLHKGKSWIPKPEDDQDTIFYLLEKAGGNSWAADSIFRKWLMTKVPNIEIEIVY